MLFRMHITHMSRDLGRSRVTLDALTRLLTKPVKVENLLDLLDEALADLAARQASIDDAQLRYRRDPSALPSTFTKAACEKRSLDAELRLTRSEIKKSVAAWSRSRDSRVVAWCERLKVRRDNVLARLGEANEAVRTERHEARQERGLAA
jgi:hypothetical protein